MESWMQIHTVINLIAYTTRVAMVDISEQIIAEVMKDVENVKSDMYYVGLEILKERMDATRDKIFSKDLKPEALYQKKKDNSPTILEQVLANRAELEQFAVEKNIYKSDILSIVKGKYMLYAFVMAVYEGIRNLNTLCCEGKIEQCDYCINGQYEHCIWRVKNQLSRSEYNNIAVDLAWMTETQIDYIRERLYMLGEDGGV